MKHSSIYRNSLHSLFISLSFFGGSLFLGHLSAQSAITDSASIPKSKTIRMGNFEFEQFELSYKVNRTANYDSAKFAQSDTGRRKSAQNTEARPRSSSAALVWLQPDTAAS